MTEQVSWIIEFQGVQKPLDEILDAVSAIVCPLRATVQNALDQAADPQELDGLRVVVYAEEENGGAAWGFRFEGSPSSVNYAVSLVGALAPIVPPTH
ncbi:hypothetical protein SAMN05216456_1466 [Devosia crocina]|uniref:Uncharacterized protein n=1 Tax=Devosia crocina TaxID=429728 RepID=A0A1I7NAV0_9HYPH|nr:hypothetical protein [Devosia crocina]SFV31812.1 hypothetical protein SAMN05216456_1466 [Devosia crocina]